MSKKGGLKFETIDGHVYKTMYGMVLYIRYVMQSNVPLLVYQFSSWVESSWTSMGQTMLNIEANHVLLTNT
jgi:hypothetical protein